MSPPAYGRAYRDFVRWCRTRNLNPMPAHPWTVASHLRWCESRHPYAAIVKRLKAISRAHVLRCHGVPDRHPTVTRTMRQIEKRSRTDGKRSDLFRDKDFLDPADEPPIAEDQGRESSGIARRSLSTKPKLVQRRPGRKKKPKGPKAAKKKS